VNAARTVPCPTCKRPVVYDSHNRWRPFCTERCRIADLGAWASEQFRVVASDKPADDQAAPDRAETPSQQH